LGDPGQGGQGSGNIGAGGQGGGYIQQRSNNILNSRIWNSSNGATGVVVLRYPSERTISTSGLTATTNTSGADKITKINAGSGNVSWS
jgi:hypothetical protein